MKLNYHSSLFNKIRFLKTLKCRKVNLRKFYLINLTQSQEKNKNFKTLQLILDESNIEKSKYLIAIIHEKKIKIIAHK